MMKLKNLLYTSILLLFSFSCDDEPVDLGSLNQEVIEVNSELFDLIERVAGNDDPLKDISCIEFNYPLTIFTFDENHTLINLNNISSNDQFITLLESLEYTESISISYPITGTMSTGDEVLIDTNQKLKLAIQECLEEEINECNQLLQQCLWQVLYTVGDGSIYTGSFFIENSGATWYEYDGNSYIGSWSSFFLEGELHINISLNVVNETSVFWNKDWKASYTGDANIRLTWENQIMILHQVCGEYPPACGNNGLSFSECEMEPSSGIAEFTLDNYSECVLELTMFDDFVSEDEIDVSYYETSEDAESGINSIDSSMQYINLSPNQTIWVRVENTLIGNYTIIPITLIVNPC